MKKKVKVHYSSLFAIIFIVSSIYLIHSILLFEKIETTLRYTIVCIIGAIDLLILMKLFIGKRKKKKRYAYSFILIIFSLLFIFLGSNLTRIYNYFSDMNKEVINSVSLTAMKGNNYGDLSKLKDKKIGISTEGENEDLAKSIIDKYSLDKNNEIIKYESYSKLVLDLKDNKIDLAFLPTNFSDILSDREEFEEHADLWENIEIIDTEETIAKKEEVHLNGSSKDVSDPFTILLIGIDSTADGLKGANDSFNGDSLIVVTFNPHTMNATMLSIPRDSYVPITCMKNVDNKITHSAANGTKCVIDTIQKLLDIKIDAYMKINFKGVVDLVNAVGGIEIDVPYDLCEQDSQRRFGKHMVYIEAGKQILNGEQALAFARNRKNNAQFCAKKWTHGERSDFKRSEHQQMVIQAVLNKMKSFRSIDDLEKVLKIISKNLDTNMEEKEIFSFYNIAKDILISSSSNQVLNIEKLYLDGTGQMIYDERSGLVLWDYIINQKSLNAVKKAMKDNLKGTTHELIKEFSYSYGEEYEAKVIGKGYSGTEKYKLVANLVGMKLSAAETWASNNNLTLDITYDNNSTSTKGTIIEQEYPERKRIDLIPNNVMKVKVSGNGKNEQSNNKVDCVKTPNDSACIISSFVGKTKNDFESWASGFSNVIHVHYEYVESDESVGKILSQDITSGTVKDLIDGDKTINLTVAKEKTQSENDNPPLEDPPTPNGDNQDPNGNNNGGSGEDNLPPDENDNKE